MGVTHGHISSYAYAFLIEYNKYVRVKYLSIMTKLILVSTIIGISFMYKQYDSFNKNTDFLTISGEK